MLINTPHLLMAPAPVLRSGAAGLYGQLTLGLADFMSHYRPAPADARDALQKTKRWARKNVDKVQSASRPERRSALSRAIDEKDDFILPVRFDDTLVPGLPDTVQYLTAEDYSPEVLAAAISEKLGIPAFAGKASDVPPPRMTSNTGEAVFDYSFYNGRYIIGNGLLHFETKWSKASDVSIHLYNDPNSINCIAIALGAWSIGDIHDASSYNFTSRTQTPRESDIVILRNTKGFYAALRIIEVMDKTRNDGRDELRFEYASQPNVSESFEEFTTQEESR